MKNDPLAVREWSKEEVARRWFRLFPGVRDEKGQPVSADRIVVRRFLDDEERVEVCRKRLGNLSWYMRCLNSDRNEAFRGAELCPVSSASALNTK